LEGLYSISQNLKSNSISSAVKIKLFRACVESTLLYNAVTWTLTDTLSRKLDGCYTKLLRYALNHKWSDYEPNSTLYNNSLEFVSITLREKQLSFDGHCIRSKQPISELLLWDHTKLVDCKCSKGACNANYSRQLLKDILSILVVVLARNLLKFVAVCCRDRFLLLICS
jgi:hypothetical protein